MTPTRRLADTQVFPIGLGGMPMSLSSRPPEERSLRTIQAALDAGVNFIDTADAYSANSDDFGHNERLIAKALERSPRRRARRHQGRPHAHGRRRAGSSTGARSTSSAPARPR